MDPNTFWKPYTGQVGKKTLYQSVALLQPANTHYNAIITDEWIRFGDMHIPYSFELKFGTRAGAIYF